MEITTEPKSINRNIENIINQKLNKYNEIKCIDMYSGVKNKNYRINKAIIGTSSIIANQTSFNYGT